VGPQGPAGPQGPPGRDATVTCQLRLLSLVVCVVSYPSSSLMRMTRARLSRGSTTYASGERVVHKGRATLRLRPVRRMRSGRYRLTLTTIDAKGRRGVVRRSVTVRG
jgi:hypothetical protein